MSEDEKIDAMLASSCRIGGWDGKTWREWFADALATLCEEGEGFSGKRPNCDSGWERGLAAGLALVEPKVVTRWEEPEVDVDLMPKEVDWDLLRKVARSVVYRMCGLR